MKRTLLLLSAFALMSFGQMQASAAQAVVYAPAGDDTEGNTTPRTLTAGDDTNSATFTWSDTTLTITGKGDFSKVSITDHSTKVFSAAGAGKVYTKDGGTATAVKQGDKYDAATAYYGTTVTYGEAMTPSTGWNQNYSMTTTWESKLEEGKSFYACYWNSGTLIITEQITTETAGSKVNGNNDKNTDGYYYFCVANTADKENLVNETISEEQMKTITLLNEENLSTYLVQVSTITASVDNLYSKDEGSDEYVFHAKDSSWSYTKGQQLFIGTVTVDNDPIADNATFFDTTHSNYLESLTLSFAEYLPYAIDGIYSQVILKTADGEESKAQINNEITRALIKPHVIKTLNLQDTHIAAMTAHKAGVENEDPTFYFGTMGSWSDNTADTTLVTLYAPEVGEAGNTLTQGTFRYLAGLKNLYLTNGITTLAESCFDETQYTGDNNKNKLALTTIVLPNTLKVIEKNAFAGQTGIAAFTFPAGLEHIKEAAFQSTNPKDVYFLGLEAPKVDANAWGDNSYIANNSMEVEVEDGETGQTVTVNRETGYACRANYFTKNGWMTMLHYPTACTKEQAAKYTDITRYYKKIVWNADSATTDNGNDARVYYTPGKETEALKGSTSSTSSTPATKSFQNMYSNGTYGGNYDGGYADMYVGEQYLWPSMDMAYRTTVTAQNNVLWDGVTTIGEGIKNAAKADGKESTYDGDGKEYIGLHQFVFSRADVTTDKTDEYEIDKKYGDGQWHTICLPISLTKAQMKEVFGASKDEDGNEVYNIILCKFNKVDRTDEKLKLYFNDEQFANANDNDIVLKAHISYMIKAKKENAVDNENIVIKNYTMETGAPLPTNVVANAAESTASESDETETQAANAYWFISQYQTGVTIPQYSYFFSKSTKGFRFQAGTTGKWNAYTSIVMAPNGQSDKDTYFADASTNARIATIFDTDNDNTTTDIKEVEIIANGEVVKTTSNVYDLNGRLVSTNGTNGLGKGVYVAGGKKIMIK